jgi:hypothetical protein
MDWLSLQSRMPKDTDMPVRCFKLLAFEAILEGRQYDQLIYPFSK